MSNLKDSAANNNDAGVKGKEIETSSSTTKEDITLNPNHNFSDGQTTQKIPIFTETFEVTKKTEETKLNLTKRWVTTTKTIEIPVKYEELLVNDKDIDHYNEKEITEIFSNIKHKITDVFSLHHKNKDNSSSDIAHENQHHQQLQPSDIDIKKYDEETSKIDNVLQIEQQSSNMKLIPFSLKDNDYDSTSTTTKQEENIIPLWGEEITINKKMVKIGEIVIKKYEITEKQKIDVNIKSEKILVKYADERQEKI